MYFEMWQSAQNKNWYWHLKAANHQVVAASEGYVNKANCIAAIALVKSSSNAPTREL